MGCIINKNVCMCDELYTGYNNDKYMYIVIDTCNNSATHSIYIEDFNEFKRELHERYKNVKRTIHLYLYSPLWDNKYFDSSNKNESIKSGNLHLCDTCYNHIYNP